MALNENCLAPANQFTGFIPGAPLGAGSYLCNGKFLDAQLGAGNTVSTWYTQGMGEYGDIIAARDTVAGASSLQLYDASGNVNQTTDASSNITATLSYDAFGNVTDNSGPANPTVAWQGKQGYQFEQPLGLQYVRQRWYDPVTRQFISQDPLGFPDATVPWGIESGQVSGGDVNLYRYAGNNPINMNDPGGEQFGDNFGQTGGGFSFLGPLVPSAPLQNTLGVQPSHAVQRAMIAHMPTRTMAERLAKQEALRRVNEPIDVQSLGHLVTALVGFPFALAYEGSKISYRHAVANTTILATRHIEHGGSAVGVGAEAVSYNILSWLGLERTLEGTTGATLVHPQLLTVPERTESIIVGGVQFVTWIAPGASEWYIGFRNPALRDFWNLQAFHLGGYGYTRTKAIFGLTSRQEIGNLGEYIGLQTLRHQGVTGLVQIKNPSGHGIDVAGHELMQAVFGEFKASLAEKAPGLSVAQRDFENFVRTRLGLAAGAREGAWQATPAQVQAAAAKFLAELRAGGTAKGYAVEITQLGRIRYRVVVRKWH